MFALLGEERRDPERRVEKTDRMAEGAGEGVEDHDHIWENGIDNWK